MIHYGLILCDWVIDWMIHLHVDLTCIEILYFIVLLCCIILLDYCIIICIIIYIELYWELLLSNT